MYLIFKEQKKKKKIYSIDSCIFQINTTSHHFQCTINLSRCIGHNLFPHNKRALPMSSRPLGTLFIPSPYETTGEPLWETLA